MGPIDRMFLPDEWLEDFRVVVMQGDGPTTIAHFLVQLGVEAAETCNCEEELRRERENGEEGSEYYRMIEDLHDRHKEYNRTVHQILVDSNMLLKVRRVIQRDIRTTNPVIGLEEFGRIVLKRYGAELLTNFLIRQPKEGWV